MTYEVKTPMALSVTHDGKIFWGFNAELITTWDGIFPQQAFNRLKKFDHECLKVDTTNLQEGLVQILKADLKQMENDISISLKSAWIKIEPDQLLFIYSR